MGQGSSNDEMKAGIRTTTADHDQLVLAQEGSLGHVYWRTDKDSLTLDFLAWRGVARGEKRAGVVLLAVVIRSHKQINRSPDWTHHTCEPSASGAISCQERPNFDTNLRLVRKKKKIIANSFPTRPRCERCASKPAVCCLLPAAPLPLLLTIHP